MRPRRATAALALAACALLRPVFAHEGNVHLYAAGSLRAAMTEVSAAFKAAGGAPVEGFYGPSGMLRDRLAKGERAEVFASANLEYPKSLHAAGRSTA